MNNYSIIISYRNRETHLYYQLESLFNVFKNKKYEILICEQDDDDKFKKSILYNVGAKVSSGDILIFHDVDHIPTDNVDYFKLEKKNLDVWYPIYNVFYVDYNFKELSQDKIPSGYRSHKYKVHDDHFGGVFICKRNVFENVNGMNPLYKGWGAEDAGIRNRFIKNGYKIVRADKGEGTFYALPHEDNCPSVPDKDFINNHIILQNENPNDGISNTNAKYEILEFDTKNELYKNCKWLKIKI